MEIVFPRPLWTLSHPQRLAVFRLLMRRYRDRLLATELVQARGLKPNVLSIYINGPRLAGWGSQKRLRSLLRYATQMDSARHTIDYLLHCCCRGLSAICALKPCPPPDKEVPIPDRKYSVLFTCTGNPARPTFAQSLLRDIGGDCFDGCSAGSAPRWRPNPFAPKGVGQKGHDVSIQRSKNIAEFQNADAPLFDFVFTVCNQAANEEGPFWQEQPISAPWGMRDPVKVAGTHAEKSHDLQMIYGALRNRMIAFSALPPASLDRFSLRKVVDEIGQSDEEGPSR